MTGRWLAADATGERQALERQIGCFSVLMSDGDACVRAHLCLRKAEA